MNKNETLDIIQELLNLIRAQGRRIARLEAHSALQDYALATLLEYAGDRLATAASYEAVRKSALEIAEATDDQEALRSLLRVMDSTFQPQRD